MKRIKELKLYQKTILVLLAIMFIAFTIVYFLSSSRVGYAYKGAFLVPHDENGSVIYTGHVDGKDAHITVSPDKTVTFQYDDIIYGPYTVKEDSSAIPDESDMTEYMTGEYVTGVEILQGSSVFFRGGIFEIGGSNSEMILVDEDGNFNDIGISYTSSDGIERDVNGNPIDQLAPSASDILELMNDPELTSKGEWMTWFWFGGVFLSVLTVVHILFADELFHWNLAFRIHNVDRVEPSELEIAGRYFIWAVFLVASLVIYIMGLTINPL